MSLKSRIRGLNFDGTVQVIEDTLTAQLIDFTRGDVYRFETNAQKLQTDFKRYLVVRKLTELFQELTLNNQIYISQDGQLVLPIEVTFRGRLQPLRIQLNLKKEQIVDQRQLNRIFLRQMERMSRESAFVDKYKEKIIFFKGDQSNLNFKNFQLSNAGKSVKYIGNNAHSIYNHFEPLPKSGIFYYQVKIIKTHAKNLIFGVCTGEIKSLINTYHSPNFIGLLLSQRTVLGNNKSDVAISPVDITEARSVVRVEIDLNKGVISWFLDGGFLCARKLPRQILVKQVFPLISFYNNGDTVEFIAQE